MPYRNNEISFIIVAIFLLFRITGALCTADSANNQDLIQLVKNMKRLCPENLVEFTCADVKAKFSKTLNCDENCGIIFDKSGGMVFASKAVKTVQVFLSF